MTCQLYQVTRALGGGRRTSGPGMKTEELLLVLISTSGCGGLQEVLRLEDIMPDPSNQTYDKSVPPLFRNQPAIVFLHMTVLMLDSFDQNEMTFTTDMFLALTWRDHRLRLPTFEETDNYRILDVRWIKHIWRPDCIFKNAKEIDFQVLFVSSNVYRQGEGATDNQSWSEPVIIMEISDPEVYIWFEKQYCRYLGLAGI